VLVASVVGTFLAISVERVRTRYVDDDFLMLVVPLLGMAAVLYLTSSFPS
jgi:type III secretory pathway component EscS